MNPNYNSIDFTEVEHLFEDQSPREPGESILHIRNAMVRHEANEFKSISVKFHYDKMRRVSEEKQDYFFAPLPNTPFTLGIVISSEVNDIIPCFNGALVQATPENIEVFNQQIEQLDDPEGYANLTLAYETAFQLLRKYYDSRHCVTNSTCNQAIMLVTDGVAGNTTEVFQKYNWGNGENGTSQMDTRVFTYLLGKEVTKVREIQWMACLNRGYYSHVQTLDEVHEEVLKYVDVIATPLVLQNEQHPPTWTHAFTDKTVRVYSHILKWFHNINFKSLE